MATHLGVATDVSRSALVGRTPADRRFFTTMACVMAAIVFVGFAPTFYLRPAFRPEPLPAVFAIHGTVFTAWIVLLVVQTALISARRTAVHRKLGVVGGGLAALMLIVGYMAAVTAARRGFVTPGLPPPLVFFAVPLFDLIVFLLLVGAALYYRRTPAAHKRLMLLSTIAILTAAVARLPGVLPYGPLMFFGLTNILVVVMLVYDRVTLGRIHPATIWGSLLFVLSQPLRIFISGTEAWLKMAHWLTGV
jgi:hypothetical protein